MNILGIDHGSKRVGLALGSTDAGVAVPLRVLEHRDLPLLIKEIKAVIASESIGRVVVGLPLSKGGGFSEQTGLARAFATNLQAEINIAVIMEDERLSSREIEAHMDAMGGKKAWKASGIDRDSAAAALFLQSYLDRLKKE